MKTNERLLSARILTFSIATALMVISYVIYEEYSDEIQSKINTAITEALPDLDRSLAQL